MLDFLPFVVTLGPIRSMHTKLREGLIVYASDLQTHTYFIPLRSINQ